MSGRRIFYGWFIVIVCFLSLFTVTGIALLSFPVFVKPLEQEFGWSRTWLLGGVAVAAIAVGILLPFLGHLMDTLSVRKIMAGGVFLTGFSFLLIANMTSLFTWYLGLLLIGIGVAASTYIPVATLVTRWFVRQQGLAMSLAMAGLGAGGFVMPNAASALVQTGGWRMAYIVFAAVIFLFLLPLVTLVIRSHPRDLGLKALDEEKAEKRSAERSPDEFEQAPLGVKDAVKTGNFWAIGFADFCNAFAVVGLGANLVAFAVESGISASIAALAYSLINAVTVAAIVVVGLTTGQFNHRIVISAAYAVPALGVIVLFNLQQAGPLFFFALVAGISAAGRLTLWPIVVNKAFGARAYASVMGLLIIFYAVGIAAAPPVTGFIYDTTKGYRAIFLIAISAFVLSGLFIARGTGARKAVMAPCGNRQ
jgi:MFS family permease